MRHKLTPLKHFKLVARNGKKMYGRSQYSKNLIKSTLNCNRAFKIDINYVASINSYDYSLIYALFTNIIPKKENVKLSFKLPLSISL